MSTKSNAWNRIDKGNGQKHQWEYEQTIGRSQKSDVIAYQVRQSFKPGEVTPEEANRIGYEFAERFLKGKHAFIHVQQLLFTLFVCKLHNTQRLLLYHESSNSSIDPYVKKGIGFFVGCTD